MVPTTIARWAGAAWPVMQKSSSSAESLESSPAAAPAFGNCLVESQGVVNV